VFDHNGSVLIWGQKYKIIYRLASSFLSFICDERSLPIRLKYWMTGFAKLESPYDYKRKNRSPE
jgi:hypothetical protein